MLSPLAALLLLAAGAADIRHRVIPDAIPFMLAGCGILQLLLSGDVIALAFRLLLALAVFGLGFVAFSFGLVGGGDVKLLAGTSLWLTPTAFPTFLLWTAVLGALIALAVLLIRAVRRHAFAACLEARATVPYGAAIALSACAVLWLDR